ncbi:MAG TPA: secretin N-terminal domain-containing protein [Phycisphaerales bacterium]|nr:secretin N-terminal domain-containing protein [Phycisphaerales bacterium]HMP36389.1 secretin N-terminal domain-containing protein [Phycisphaerales bacterium]
MTPRRSNQIGVALLIASAGLVGTFVLLPGSAERASADERRAGAGLAAATLPEALQGEAASDATITGSAEPVGAFGAPDLTSGMIAQASLGAIAADPGSGFDAQSAERSDDEDGVEVEMPQAAPEAAAQTSPPPATAIDRGQDVLIQAPAAKADEEEMVRLAFKDTPLVDTIRFIAETTGKVVILRPIQVSTAKITLLSDRPVPRREALDLLFKAFRLNNIGVVQTDREIILDSINELANIQDPGVILGPDDSVLDRTDDGTIINKIFRLRVAKAQDVADQLGDLVPAYAKLKADVNTNQILFEGNVGLAKRFQILINQLDKPAFINLRTETFRLKHADAQVISQTIVDLFEARSQGSARPQQPRPGQNVRQPQQQRQPGQASLEGIFVSEQLRVSVLPAINAVVVSAEPEIVSEIGRLVRDFWDLSPSAREGDLIRVYTLRYADPVAVRNVLQTMLEGQSAGGGRGGARGGAAGAARAGVGGESGADVAVANIFRIDAIPDARQLVIISKTPENFVWLDQVIAEIDRETSVGLPKLIPLRYANAVEVAEQLNALFAEPGTEASIRGAETGLTLGDIGLTTLTGGNAGGGATGGATGGAGGGNQQANVITFPWQGGRSGTDDRTPESRIIGKVRIVPNIRQNALMVLAAPDLQQAVVDMITTLDRPGRQVLIAAVIAAVELKDDFAFGLRVSREGIVTPNGANTIGGSIENNNTQNDFLNFFSTSILNVNVDAFFVLQALDQKTNVKVLQQPKLFVSDNTEGVVFIGQEIPFISNSSTNDFGLNQSFDYIPVGVTLNVRPRITANRDVAMEIRLELSNVVPGVTILGGAVLDRRRTQTNVTLRNGQTVILSGIRVEDQSDIKRKVPLLGDIPGIGDLLFTSTDKANSVSELLAFVTPIVVDNPEENDYNFNEDARRRLQDLRRPLSELITDENRSEPFEPVKNPGQIPAIPGGPPTAPMSEAPVGGGVVTSSSLSPEAAVPPQTIVVPDSDGEEPKPKGGRGGMGR